MIWADEGGPYMVTIECPVCSGEAHIPREKWPGKFSDEPLPCFHCMLVSEAREWRFICVPYMRLAWSA